jgi:hypothetical protein
MEKASKFLHKESLTVPPNQILIPLNMWRIFLRESLGTPERDEGFPSE